MKEFKKPWWMAVLLLLGTSCLALFLTEPSPSAIHLMLFGLGFGAGVGFTRAMDSLNTWMRSKRRH
jgi:hypothetical protein